MIRIRDWRLFTCLVVTLFGSMPVSLNAETPVVKENDPSPPPVMSLKIYDIEGKVLVDVKSKVAPKPKNDAFDVLRKIVVVDFDTYPGDIDQKFTGGAFTNGLIGVSPPPGYYWALYVDGTYSQKGISDITITKNTLIEWKIEKFKESPK